jgi:putative glutathione S-transferase
VPDPVLGARFVRDLYEAAGEALPPGTRYTVPLLFDTRTRRVVNNESEDLVRMFNADFQAFAAHKELDLYPAALRGVVDDVNAWVYPSINNGECAAAPMRASVRCCR